MRYILETERLKLRELVLEDATFIIRLLNSPGWLQFIGDRNVKNEEQAKNYLLDGPLRSYRENGFGLFLVEKTNDKCKIGICGLKKRDILDDPDLGFAFLPEFIGKGYAFEIISALLSYAENHLKLPKIAAITLPENEKSIRLLNKIGFHFTEKINSKEDSKTLFLYYISLFPENHSEK